MMSRKTNTIITLAFAFASGLVVGCDGIDDGSSDLELEEESSAIYWRPPLRDAGYRLADAGRSVYDAGRVVDGGQRADAGQSTDGGQRTDAGSAPRDAGTTPIDAGPTGSCQQATLLWSDDFETGDFSRWTGNNYDGDSSACNTAAISTEQSVSSNRSAKGCITCAKSTSHRPYGGVQFSGDTVLENFTNSGEGILAPHGVVNTFWGWLDTPTTFGPGLWLSNFTVSGACNWGEEVITLGIASASRLYESAHTYPGNGGSVTFAPNPPTFPLRRWARTTIYINYYQSVMRVWLDGRKVFDVTFTRPSLDICHFHWGAYSSGNNSDITFYEDDFSIWKLTAPLVDTNAEPINYCGN